MVLGNLGYSAGSLFSLHYFFHILGPHQASINDEFRVNASRFSLVILKNAIYNQILDWAAVNFLYFFPFWIRNDSFFGINQTSFQSDTT